MANDAALAKALDEMEGSNLVIVSGGFALTTLRSTIRFLLDVYQRGRFKKITAIYGARSPADLCFKYDLDAWEKDKTINMVTTVDKGDESWTGREGFVPAVLEQVAPSANNAMVIVCGPPIMIRFTFPVLEKRMKCGIGKCGRCNIGNLYVCRDGPVFTYAQIKSFVSSEY